MTRRKRIDTEQVNKKVNNAFYREENYEDNDVEQLINNNHIEQVLNNSKENGKDNEDM